MTTSASLLELAREAMERYLEVRVDDDGVITFSHADIPCVIQASELADGLDVLSLTCVVAWDRPAGPELEEAVAHRAGQGLFGTLGVVRTDRGVDVTLRYAFPAAGLDATALGTLLMIVVSTASKLRMDLPGMA
jgi:hypothetical protein